MPDDLDELAEFLGGSSVPSPLLVMLAGSNGAGKSTLIALSRSLKTDGSFVRPSSC